MTERLLHGAAVELVRRQVDERSRLLLLGAGGWFGSTLLNLLDAAGLDIPVLPVASRPRRLVTPKSEWKISAWDYAAAAKFAPSIVVNCAFLTRERVEEMGFDNYVAANVVLTSRFLQSLSLPTVSAAVAVSSGAAVKVTSDPLDVESNPYGYLKWVEEVAAHNVAVTQDVALTVCRAWSVSGAFVRRPRDYAFSDLICQAESGEIAIRAGHEVWRRYAGVDDLLAVCLALAARGASDTIDSGGELVEIGQLARRVSAVVCPGASISRPSISGPASDRYHSDGSSWAEACRRLGHVPAALDEQVRLAAAGLLRA